MIEKFIDSQLNPLSAFMTAEQVLAQKKQMLERFISAESRYGFLEMWIGQEILYMRRDPSSPPTNDPADRPILGRACTRARTTDARSSGGSRR